MSVRIDILDKQQSDMSIPDQWTTLYVDSGSEIQMVESAMTFWPKAGECQEVLFPDEQACRDAAAEIERAIAAGSGEILFERKWDGVKQLDPE